jgi:hypothetical protein
MVSLAEPDPATGQLGSAAAIGASDSAITADTTTAANRMTNLLHQVSSLG